MSTETDTVVGEEPNYLSTTDPSNVSAAMTPQNYQDVPAYLQWTNRRRMAWASLLSMLLMTVTFVFYVPINRLAVLQEVVMWFYFTMSAIVGSYMGFTTLHAALANRKKT